MSPTPVFELKNISKYYGEVSSLSSLSFRIDRGEVVALIGPSGAGKTTLLNILSAMLPPDDGTFFIDGKPVSSLTSRRQRARKLGIIRQQFDLVGPLPVVHNVLAGRLGEWSLFKSLLSYLFLQDKELAMHALHRVGLKDKIYEKTAHLSGGEQQRVALARLLVQKPEVILADEPVSSLDPARAEDIIGMLVRLVKEENQTLIASLHSVDLARKYFTRIIALRDGQIFFDLPVDQVTSQQLSDLYKIMEMKEDAEVC
ncbi:MAG: phosphonate ABC transporter ATP-binding protein [Bacillaceae bacterium]|nr:phosphonate ABC transporter ATP-binding protein [Bacillaceae bacterium]